MNELTFSQTNKTGTSVENDIPPLSRRQWLNRIGVPALATIGAGMIGANAFGSPKKEKPEDNLLGARTYNVRILVLKAMEKRWIHWPFKLLLMHVLKITEEKCYFPRVIFLQVRSN